MRCLACQVDLNETVTKCPLCGAAAEDAPAQLEGIAFQDYPVCEPVKPEKQPRKKGRKRTMTLREKSRAMMKT